MRKALIGHTGLVGKNLKQQCCFTDLYNSKNFQEMNNQQYDLVVCAGVSSLKWMANKYPKKDLDAIKSLKEVLSTILVKKFVLISTIDVYSTTQQLDEDFDCNIMENHAYGTHRLVFEKFCIDKFKNCTTLRLPALFGNGLKKNVIYDLLNDNCLEMINKNSSFQYYYLKCLWKDIQIAIDNDIKIMNLFTEPLTTQKILSRFFPEKNIGKEAIAEVHYNLHTKYAETWGTSGNYIYSKDEMMQQLLEFIEAYRNQKDNS